MTFKISTTTSPLYNKGNSTCKFYVTSLILVVIFLGQLNLPLFDVNNTSSIEIELTNEEFDADSLQAINAIVDTTHYYLSYVTHDIIVNNEPSNYFLKPSTRAPPFFS